MRAQQVAQVEAMAVGPVEHRAAVPVARVVEEDLDSRRPARMVARPSQVAVKRDRAQATQLVAAHLESLVSRSSQAVQASQVRASGKRKVSPRLKSACRSSRSA
jgi:hypothetical protein